MPATSSQPLQPPQPWPQVIRAAVLLSPILPASAQQIGSQRCRGGMSWPDLYSCVAGLVGLELYKVLQSKKVEAYRNTFANLALPLFAMAEPVPPKTVKHEKLEWSLWDRWILEGDLTVQEVVDWFQVCPLHPRLCASSCLFTRRLLSRKSPARCYLAVWLQAVPLSP